VADALCIAAAGKTLLIAASAFTLSWTHSVEKIAWQEDWQVGQDGLRIVEARVKGSGAGMEPPEGSVLKDGWWHYKPALPPQKQVRLAASGATGGGWTLCAAGECMVLGAAVGGDATLTACRSGAE
jgi:hypothetical protein